MKVYIAMSEDLKQKTAKGLLWGGIGNGVMQIASLLFGFFLLRLLSPSDYGMVGVLTIFSAIAGMFVEAGFITALVNKKEVSHKDYNAVFWFNLFMGVGLYVIMFFCAPLIAAFYKIPELVPLSRYVFLGTIFSCLGVSTTAYYLRNLKVKERSIIQMAAIFIAGTIGVVLSWFGYGYWGLATQTLAYISLSTAGMWLLCPWKPSLKIDFSPLKEMFGYSSKLLLTTLFTHINNNIFSVLLGRFYTLSQVGYYTTANKWTIMGYSTMVGMLSSVTQPVIRESLGDNGRVLKVFRKMLRFTVFVSFPVMFGLGSVSEELIVITVTDKWIPAATIMHILCVGGAFLPLTTLFSGLMNSIGRPQVYMWSTISLGIVQILCLVLTFRWGLNVMLSVYVTVNILWLLVWIHFARKHIGLTLKHFVTDVAPYLAFSLIAVYSAYFAGMPLENIYARLAVRVLLACGIYAASLYLTGSVIFRESVEFLFKKFRKR